MVVRIALLGLSVVAGLTMFGGAAQAELVGTQKTWWGVQGAGPSRTIGDWEALTWATEAVGGTVFVGGKFTQATNGSSVESQRYLAAFDAGDGKFIPWFRPNVGGPVLAIESSPDGGVFVGGEMGTWNGSSSGALVKIDPETGELWPGWRTKLTGGTAVVRDIKLESDGWLYAVGSFTSANAGGGSISVGGAVRLNPRTGAIDRNWRPRASGGSVWGVGRSVNKNEVYLAGWFTTINGNTSARGFAGVSSSNGSVLHGRDTLGYNSPAGAEKHRLYDVVATEHGTVFVAGQEHGLWVLDESQNLEIKRMHYTGCMTWITGPECAQRPKPPRRGGEFQEIERIGNRIYATCHCWQDHITSSNLILTGENAVGTNTGKISAIAAYNPRTAQRIQSFAPYMSGNSGGFAITAASDGCLWVGGGFSQVGNPGNQRRARDLVRLCDSAGPGPDPQPNPEPPKAASCSVSAAGRTATVNWSRYDGDSVIIERKVDNGNWGWRGRVDNPDRTFSEQAPNGSVTTYRVRTRWGWVKSSPTTCSPKVDLTQAATPASRPSSCSATNDGLAATVSWPAANNAVDYRVNRSIDGSRDYWRGVTSSTRFNDTLRTRGVHTYTVQARGDDGQWSASRTCNPALDPRAGGAASASRPPSCNASSNGLTATITWGAADNASDYRVYRSINGSRDYWRGISTTTRFTDTLRTSGTHTYKVQARGADGAWSASRTCGPNLTP